MKRVSAIGIKLILIGALLGLLVAGSAAAQSTGDTAAEPVRGGTLIVGRSGDSISLDPNDSPDGESSIVTQVVGEGLVRFRPGTLEVEPWLAESWEALDDGTRWRFTLRPGVKFHDGNTMTAEDVVFSFMRALDSEHEYHQYGQWGLTQAMFGQVENVEAVSELVVDFVLDRPFAAFLTALASGSRGAVVSSAAVMADPENFYKQPVATGPYRVAEWRTDERIVLVSFEDYWGERPYLDQIVFRVIPEHATRLIALRQGDIHAMTSVNASIAEAVKQSDNLVLLEAPGLMASYLAPNHLREPWSDVRVRQALFHAIDREALASAFWPSAQVAKGVMPEVMLGFNSDLEWYEYNPERARELLAEAGYATGLSATLLTFNQALRTTPEPLKTAEAIQAYLAEVGIQVNILPMEVATFLERARRAEFDLILTGYSPIVPDPWTVMFTQFDTRRSEFGSANNWSFYRNPVYDEFNDRADQESDIEARAQIYRDAQELLYSDAVRVDLVNSNEVFALSQNVHGWVTDPSGMVYFQYVWLD